MRAGNTFFLDPATGTFPPFAPSMANPFTGFILPGAGASGINIIDNSMQNPSVQQFNLGVQHMLPKDIVLRVDGVHNLGTHFIIGRPVGVVFNPVVGGPDRVVNLESSVNNGTHDAMLVSAERRGGRLGFRASYTLSKALNYANDDQIPFSNGPIDLRTTYGSNTARRQTISGIASRWPRGGMGLAACSWRRSSPLPRRYRWTFCCPMAPPVFRRFSAMRAAGRSRPEPSLNRALIDLNAKGGRSTGTRCHWSATMCDSATGFRRSILRVSRPFTWNRLRVEPMVEVFNLFNVTNILGVNVKNYSGYANVLVRDSSDSG